MRRWMKPAALAIALLGAAGAAHAALLEMIVTGTFGQGVTYTNGPTSTDLSGQPFSMTASFDSTTGTLMGQSQMFPAITTMMQTPLVNAGAPQTVSFATLLSPFIVEISDPNEPTGLQPPDPTTLGIYIAGIGDAYVSYFWLVGEFNTATPPISDAAPAPTVFSDMTWSGFGPADNLLLADGGTLVLSYTVNDPEFGPYNVALPGSTDGVQIVGLAQDPSPAPEPATLALLCTGLAALAAIRRR